MEYKRPQSSPQIKPRLIIHGGAGNIKPTNLTPERYEAVRRSLLGMVSKYRQNSMYGQARRCGLWLTNSLPFRSPRRTRTCMLLARHPHFKSRLMQSLSSRMTPCSTPEKAQSSRVMESSSSRPLSWCHGDTPNERREPWACDMSRIQVSIAGTGWWAF